jgi:hypothetical protein
MKVSEVLNPPDERTEQGTQHVLAGTAKSAKQAAAAREVHGRGKIRSSKPQRDPGPLFAPSKPDQPSLF